MINHREFTISACVCFATIPNLSRFAASGRMTLCSKPNGFFSQLPFDIPDTHAFIRCTAAVAILPNIRRKNHRDIDGTSALRFEDIALCVAKPLESCVLVCRHTIFPNTYAEVILLRLCEINIFFFIYQNIYVATFDLGNFQRFRGTSIALS